MNGEKLIEIFFPSKCCPVFLSHSGLDKSRVEQFAQWLKKNFEINSFIDSDLWGCITDLQREIDQECKENASKQSIERYIKSRCSGTPFNANKYESTTHAHIMLCQALAHIVNHIANITIVDDFLNKRKIQDKAPSKYIKEFKKNKKLESALQTHLICIPNQENADDSKMTFQELLADWGITKDDYEVFFKKRLEQFNKELKERVILTNLDRS